MFPTYLPYGQLIRSFWNQPQSPQAQAGRPFTVKKLATVLENNPGFVQDLNKKPGLVKKLVKDPAVVKTAAILEKNNVKITKNTVNQLRVPAANDPVKLRKLNVVDRLLGLGSVAVFIGIALVIVLAIGGSIAAWVA
ncbi:unnamed protein product [Phytophthora fragariaefolia]|uniref:Unnamed protein product n=1 Tax=Phytophthora fragariaefolia TaxID=1490495 RepID=A0A9W6XMQ7_9STRA|nr:unnamed protein product [Phytophthora fragariaefolia]